MANAFKAILGLAAIAALLVAVFLATFVLPRYAWQAFARNDQQTLEDKWARQKKALDANPGKDLPQLRAEGRDDL